MIELAPGLWRWTARHPDWTPEEGGEDGWDPDVGCLWVDTPDEIVLIDPLLTDEVRALLEDESRAVHVLLTVFWHERSAKELRERGADVWATPGTIARELEVEVTHPFRWTEELPGGLRAIDAYRRGEAIYWLPEQRALATGDVILGDRDGGVRVCPDSWLPEELRGPVIRGKLRPLLDLPVERVLVSHGEPVLEDGRAALERALS